MRLPGGFSPVSLLKEAASSVPGSPNRGADYDVFGDVSVKGGVRSPANGALIGPQVKGAVTNTPSTGWTQPNNTPNNTPNNAPANAAPDPYARWGGRENFDALKAEILAGQSGAKKGASTQLRDVTDTYRGKTRSFLNELEDTQGGINRGAGENALNLRTSMSNIVRGIQQGIRSGRVSLAGMNASDSGASDALNRAYAQVGNSQTGEARGEAASVSDDLQRQQGLLNRNRTEGVEDLERWQDTETDRVKSDFSNKLEILEARAAREGLNDVVKQDIVSTVLNEALDRIQSIDADRKQRLSGIKQWTPEQVMAEAIRREQAGEAGDAFSVTDPNVQYGSGGPEVVGAPLGQLPIYVKNRDELAAVPRPEEDQLI